MLSLDAPGSVRRVELLIRFGTCRAVSAPRDVSHLTGARPPLDMTINFLASNDLSPKDESFQFQ